jgi:peptidoglycan/xylan/chitin deacetylase (PgdA/CDA1 family)
MTDPEEAAPDAVNPAYIPVLLYHAIGSYLRPGLEEFTTSDDDFDAHVRVFAAYRERGWTPMLVTDLAVALRGMAPMPTRPFAVTFDDGYDDNVGAIDRLAVAGIPSTIYVTASYVDQPGFLTRDEIRALAARDDVEVGAHSVRHRRLDELSRPAIAGELRGCRTFLNAITEGPIQSVAYPHGNHDERVLDEAARAGYLSGAAVKNALSRPGDDPLAIARWTVLARHTAADIEAVMDGRAPIVGMGEHLSTRVYRHARRARAQSRALLGRGN